MRKSLIGQDVRLLVSQHGAKPGSRPPARAIHVSPVLESGPADYDQVWASWGDMSECAPTPIHLRRMIVNEARRLSFQSILDVGCGNGILLSVLQKHFSHCRLAGGDISRTAVEKARAQWRNIPFHVLDIQKEYLDQRYELITLAEVIEHVEEPLASMVNLRRMCSGHLILTTPTGRRLPTDLAFYHLRHFAPQELRQLALDAGFVDPRVYLWGWPFQVLFRKIINLVPNWSHNQFVSGGRYGLLKRIVSAIWAKLFYLNMKGKGTQMVLVARAC